MKRIAVVDDMGTARMFIKRCLEAIGFSEAEYYEFQNGQEVLDALQENSFDLIVTDLTMPVLDGEMLLKSIKSSTEHKNTVVVVISSAGNPAKEKELIDAGAMGVLAKPFAPAQLYQMLQPLIAEG